jgi:hypothetical protein
MPLGELFVSGPRKGVLLTSLPRSRTSRLGMRSMVMPTRTQNQLPPVDRRIRCPCRSGPPPRALPICSVHSNGLTAEVRGHASARRTPPLLPSLHQSLSPVLSGPGETQERWEIMCPRTIQWHHYRAKPARGSATSTRCVVGAADPGFPFALLPSSMVPSPLIFHRGEDNLASGGVWKMVRRTRACFVGVINVLLTVMPVVAQVMSKSPSPAQPSPQQSTPMQPTSPRPTMQPVPSLQLNCVYFQRNANGSWTQRSPVTVDGETLNTPGMRIKPGTIVGGIELVAALNRQCP